MHRRSSLKMKQALTSENRGPRMGIHLDHPHDKDPEAQETAHAPTGSPLLRTIRILRMRLAMVWP